MARLRRVVPARALELIWSAAGAADARGQRLYLVGGVVRDALLDRRCLDIDLVLEGDALALAQEAAGGRRLVAHSRFGTATVKEEGFSLDFATARRETYLRPGALPDVKPGNILDDLFRRDFTINAVALPLNGEHRGELLDPWGGREDLDRGLVRILHDSSFVDDATRMLRAARYEQRFGFRLEDGTESLLRRSLPMLQTVSADRLRHEIDRILLEDQPERPLRRAGELGMLDCLCAPLPCNGAVAGRFSGMRRSNRPGPLALRYALYLYDLDTPRAEETIARFNLPGKTSRVILETIRLKERLATLASGTPKPADIFNFLRGYDREAVAANIIASSQPEAAARMSLFLDRLRNVRTLLNGDSVIAMGVRPGPEVGEVLARLLEARLNGEVETREDEEGMVRRMVQRPAFEL